MNASQPKSQNPNNTKVLSKGSSSNAAPCFSQALLEGSTIIGINDMTSMCFSFTLK